MSSQNRLPSLARVLEVFDYDEVTGVFTRRFSISQHLGGSKAGTVNKQGYVSITIDACHVPAHRLAWFYVRGEWPSAQVDHINGDRIDNRIANLRLATRSQNAWNAKRHRDNRTGFKGVHFNAPKNKFAAQISANGRRRTLGYFDTPEEAHAAYVAAAHERFGEYARAV